jgi:hypothetical protein
VLKSVITSIARRQHTQLLHDRPPNGLGATNTVFAHNVLQGGDAAASLNGIYTCGEWSGNIT